MVERDLAKVEVAGSIPVIRSKRDGHDKGVPVKLCKSEYFWYSVNIIAVASKKLWRRRQMYGAIAKR